MKTICSMLIAAISLAACTNAGRSEENKTDSLNQVNDSLASKDNSDPNNRNTTTYDSAARSGDTASYERMSQLNKDTTRH